MKNHVPKMEMTRVFKSYKCWTTQ